VRIAALLPFPGHSRDNTFMRPLPVANTEDLPIEAMQEPSEALFCRLRMDVRDPLTIEADGPSVCPEGEVSIPIEIVLVALHHIHPGPDEGGLDLVCLLLY